MARITKRPEARVTTILVPVDLSDSERGALEFAALLAQRLGAQIELLHVIEHQEDLHEQDLFTSIGTGPARPVSDVVRGVVRQKLCGLTRELKKATGVMIRCRVEFGVVHELILTLAEIGACDYIVMNRRARSGAGRWLMGSVTERVVRGAPCPVLTLPEGFDSLERAFGVHAAQ